MMKNMERLQKKGIMLFVLVLTLFLALMNYAYGDFFFTTNSSTDYNWSAGGFYQTKVVGDVNITLNNSNDVQGGTELPNSLAVESWANMSGNVLLLHFNNNSAYGENDSLVYDFSGNQNNGVGYLGAHYNLTNKKLGAGAFEFDGSDDYIEVPTIFNLGKANASIGAWVYLGSASENGGFVKVGDSGGYGIGVGTNDWDTGGNNLIIKFEGIRWIDTNTAIGTGWHHVMMTIPSTGIPNAYIDGIFIDSYSGDDASVPNVRTTIGQGEIGDTQFFSGTIDEVAIWNMTLSASEISDIYEKQKGYYPSGNYTSQTFDGNVGANWTDISWKADLSSGGQDLDNYTKLLLHMDGDASASDHTWTAKGDPVLNASMPANNTAEFGGSMRFDGTGDYLSAAHSADWAFGTTWTFELWVNFATLTGEQFFYSTRDGDGLVWFRKDADHDLAFYFRDTSNVAQGDYKTTSAAPLIANTWHHIAFVRNSATAYIFLDGVSLGVTETDPFGDVIDLTTGIEIGKEESGTSYFNGYMDELRISKGTARWTSNFDVPTRPYTPDNDNLSLTVDENVTLMLHFDGDVSGQNHTVTLANVTSNATEYRFDGSYYFDGASYLNISDSDGWDFGTEAFTIDFWMYSFTNNNGYLFDFRDATNTDNPYLYHGSADDKLHAYVDGNPEIETSVVSYNEWHHVAFVVQPSGVSNNFKIFVDGFLIGNVTKTFNLAGDGLDIGRYYGESSYFNGYLDEFRISKGIARWTESFDPPVRAYPFNRTSLTVQTRTSNDASTWTEFTPVGGEDDYNVLLLDFDYPASSANATGGTITYDGGYTVHTFTSSGTFTPNGELDVWYLVVGGGGAGVVETEYYTGGGGGGGYRTNGAYDHTVTEQAYSITVGAGGTKATPVGGSGGVSTFDTITSAGGGGGGFSDNGGANGGSGGGAGRRSQTGGSGDTPDTTPDQGTDGGDTDAEDSGGGGGGGGAGGAGGNNNGLTGGAGGDAQASTITGSSIYYAGGGFGGKGWEGTDGAAGTGYNNIANRGMGGNPDVDGGSGIVIIRYLTNSTDKFNTNDTTDETERHRLTFNGDAGYKNDSYKFGTSSAYFDGTGDYIDIADSGDWSFGSDDFTIDFWVKHNSLPGDQQGWVGQDSVMNEYWEFRLDSSGARFVDYSTVGGGTIVSLSQGSLSGWAIDTWYHVALVKSGNDYTIYRDGNSIVSTTDSDALTDYSAPLHIGLVQKANSGGMEINGSIDEFRITKGLARWTENFTVPSGPYTKPLSNPSGGINGSARYLEYKANFQTESSSYSPVLEWVNLSYLPGSPTVGSWVYPTADDATNNTNITFEWNNCTGGTAPYNFSLYVNKELYHNGTGLNWTSNFTAVGTYNYTLSCVDAISLWSENITTRNITIDWSVPTITINYTPSGTTTDLIEYVNITLEDDRALYSYNISIWNVSSGELLLSEYNNTLQGTWQYVSYLINNSNFTYWDIKGNISVWDASTARKLKKLKHEYSDGVFTFSNKNKKNKKFDIELGYYNNGNVHKLTKKQIRDYNATQIINKKYDRIEFGASFNLPNQNFIFGFKVPKLPSMRLYDQKTGHFVVHNEFWVDFSLRLNNNWRILPSVESRGSNYYVYWDINWQDYGISQGDLVTIMTESVGELNTDSYEFYYNYTADEIFVRQFANMTWYNGTEINHSVHLIVVNNGSGAITFNVTPDSSLAGTSEVTLNAGQIYETKWDNHSTRDDYTTGDDHWVNFTAVQLQHSYGEVFTTSNTLSIINPIDPATKVPASCICPSAGVWEIINGDGCNLDSICDIGNNVVRVFDGALRILTGGSLKTRGLFVNESQGFHIDDGGGIFIEE